MKTFTLFSTMCLLLCSITFAHSESKKKLTEYADPDCWNMAIDIYHVFEDTGHDREKCVEMAIWTYELCVELEEDLD
ncbi:hypothetical protein [Kordia sp.]|uniref:hypothetical protein n=1 Tax=Kordia sp. TaxID=1965332 RepID=UPI003D28A5D2